MSNLDTRDPGDLPPGNVSNLDTGDPGDLPAENVSNLDTRDPGDLPTGNVSKLDTGDPGSCRPRMCPTWTPGIQGAAAQECVQLGHRGFKIFFSLPPALLKPNPNKAKEQEKHIVALLFFLCLLA